MPTNTVALGHNQPYSTFTFKLYLFLNIKAKIVCEIIVFITYIKLIMIIIIVIESLNK